MKDINKNIEEEFEQICEEVHAEKVLNRQLSQAIILATKMHDGQVDKGEKPYILHPLSIMMKVRDIEEKIVAVLHDILEDTDTTEYELRNYYGFSDKIIDAIVCLTRKKNESYNKYIKRVATNDLAITVKMVDLDHNMDLSRLGHEPTEKDLKRNEKYKQAYYYLWDKC